MLSWGNDRIWLATVGIVVGVVSAASAQTVTTVMNNGPSNNRVDLVFIGDGYTSSQIDSVYSSHVQGEINYLFSGAFRNPFPRYEQFFNVHRVNIVSNESGADQPPNGIFKDTALDASYWWGGSVERCLYFDTGKANTAVNTALAGTGIDIDARFGVVNDSKYGGCGGSWAVYAGANSSATDIAVHELGHSLGQLADEYFSSGTQYSGGEPSSVNLTTAPGLGKWDRWVGYNDPDTNIGAINYFEGGGYNETGLFRPSNNSEMRSLSRPFDAISREQFITRFYDEVDPLDAWLDNSISLEDPAALWVDTVDPAVINVEWLLDGTSLGVLGESLDISMLGLATGGHTVTARSYDAILDHTFTGDSLDWYRKADTTALQQSVTWSIDITNTGNGDFNGDGIYTCDDVDALVLEIVNQTGATQFDLTGDGTTDQADLNAWLAEAGAATLPSGGAYLPGDANLDGTVDGQDFLVWNSHKFSSAPSWCSGDFDANGVVDGGDFLIWNANKFTSSSSNLVAVPEPVGMIGIVLGMLFWKPRISRSR